MVETKDIFSMANRFCLLTDESVERLPPPDTSNI